MWIRGKRRCRERVHFRFFPNIFPAGNSEFTDAAQRFSYDQVIYLQQTGRCLTSPGFLWQCQVQYIEIASTSVKSRGSASECQYLLVPNINSQPKPSKTETGFTQK